VGEVTDGLIAATWGTAGPDDGARRQVLRAVQRVTLERPLEQAASHPVGQVRAILTDRLLSLAACLERDPDAGAFERLAAADIRRWARRGMRALPPPAAPEAPRRQPDRVAAPAYHSMALDASRMAQSPCVELRRRRRAR